MFVQGAFGLAWSPFSIKLISDTPNYRQIYSKILTLWFFVLALLGYIVSVFSNEVLIALTPKEYWDSSISVGIIAIGLVFFGTTQVTALGMSIEKKTHLLTYAAWITAVTNFLLNLLLIPLYGAEGSAIATLVSYVILTSYYLWYTQILHPIPLEINKLLYCVFIICISLVVPHIFIQPQIIPIAIFIKISIFTLILVGAFYCNIIEKNIFLKLMKIK
jgi:O-antigen/teichoic acid export membrane protein